MKKIFASIKEFIHAKPGLSVVLLIAIIAVFTYGNIQVMHITSEPGFCEMCHPGTDTGALSEVHTWRQNIHAEAGVKCLDCHGEPGFMGYTKAKIGGLYDVYAEIFYSEEFKLEILNRSIDDPQYAANLVPSTTCLFCHSDSVNQQIRDKRWMSVGHEFRLLDGVNNPAYRQQQGMRDILMDELEGEVDPNHKKHIDAGLSCMDCHHRMVHGGEYRAAVDLDNCLNCHNERGGEISMSPIVFGQSDSAVEFSHDFHNMMFDCNTCHTGLFPMKAGDSEITFADHSSNNTCYACHNGQAASYDCKSCHGQTPIPQEPITYTMDGIGPVDFNHSFHGAVFSCNDCHDEPWPMEAHATPMTMNEMYQGKYCGSCHDGQAAFSATSCAQCHK